MIVMSVSDSFRRPLRDLRISVTDRCNFRCVYCMPREVFGRDYEFLERAELLTFEEIERLARIFVGDHGVEKIRLTGGEPLVRREVERLVEMLARIPGLGDLAMTTNGSALARKARALGDAGLRRITVSLAQRRAGAGSQRTARFRRRGEPRSRSTPTGPAPRRILAAPVRRGRSPASRTRA